MRFVFLLMMIFLNVLIGFAQKDILNNPNVTWAAEVYTNIDLQYTKNNSKWSGHDLNNKINEKHKHIPLKYENPDPSNLNSVLYEHKFSEEGFNIYQILAKQGRSSDFEIFKDAQLTHKITGDEKNWLEFTLIRHITVSWGPIH